MKTTRRRGVDIELNVCQLVNGTWTADFTRQTGESAETISYSTDHQYPDRQTAEFQTLEGARLAIDELLSGDSSEFDESQTCAAGKK